MDLQHSDNGLVLPSEIMQLMWTFCDTATLRNARLGCSTWAYDMIGLFLFDRITLIPHLYFMERFLFIFESSQIRHHIKQIVIDLPWADFMLDLHQRSKRFPGYNTQCRAHETSMYDLDSLYKWYINRNEHLQAMESAAFIAIFCSTPSLSTVVMNSEYDPCCNWHKMVEKRNYYTKAPALIALLSSFGIIGNMAFNNNPTETWLNKPPIYWSVFDALSAGAPQLDKLILDNFDPVVLLTGEVGGLAGLDPADWQDEDETHTHPAHVFGRILSCLPDLDMRLESGRRGVVEEDIAWATVDILRRTASKILSLELSCDETLPNRIGSYWVPSNQDPDLGNGKPVLPFFFRAGELSPEPALNALRYLWLEDTACSTVELNHFLVHECPRLSSLTLKNLVLIGETKDSRPLQCWVATLKSLRDRLTLTTVNFGGYLTNLGQQNWFVAKDLPYSKQKMKSRLIDWMLDKSIPCEACPLNVFEVQTGDDDVVRSEDILLVCSDDSWSWVSQKDFDTLAASGKRIRR